MWRCVGKLRQQRKSVSSSRCCNVCCWAQLYDNFVSKFEAKLNQVRLAELLYIIAKSLGGERNNW